MAHKDFNDHSFNTDKVGVPDPGLDTNRVKSFDFNGTPPADDGFPHYFQGEKAPSSLPGEPSHNKMDVSFAPNQFPHQKGSDSLSDEEAVIS